MLAGVKEKMISMRWTIKIPAF